MITVRIPVEDIATQLLTYQSIRLYRSTSPDGTFALVTTIPLVANRTLYSYADSGGDANSVYQHEYYHPTGPVLSSRSPSYYAGGTTLLRLRLEAAREAGAGFGSVCSALGTTTALVDATLADSGVDNAFLEGAWIYRPNAAVAGDKLRRVKEDGFTVAASSLGVDRAWTNAPANGEVYQIFNLFPPIDAPGAPYSWDRAVRQGLSFVWFVDQLNLGAGDGNTLQWALSTWPDVNTKTIRAVYFRRTDSNGNVSDLNMTLMGRYYGITENQWGSTLDFGFPPATDQNIIVEAVRRDYALYLDTDVTQAPITPAVKAILAAAYRTLNYLQPGKYAGEFALASANWQLERELSNPADLILGV